MARLNYVTNLKTKIMELVLTNQEIESLPISEHEIIHNKPMGFLTSNYKACTSIDSLNYSDHTLFGKRQNIKSRFYNTESNVDFTLKIALFLTAFLVFFI